MTGQYLRCVSCGASFRGVETSCTYCRAARPHAPLGATSVRRLVHDEVHQDRNHNGVPDVLERLLPAPRASAPPGKGNKTVYVLMGGVFVFLFAAVGVAVQLRGSPSPRRGTVLAPVETASPAAESPADTLVPTSPAPALTTPPRAEPAACKAAREQRGRNANGPTLAALERSCRTQGGDPGSASASAPSSR